MTRVAVDVVDATACCTSLVASTMTRTDASAAAAVFKALADPGRVRIVNLLANSAEPVCVCDVTEHLGVSQATTSFHLKKLLAAGLVTREERGTWAFYSLRRDALARVGAILHVEGSVA